MKLTYCVPENKKIRVILDSDTACEADDPFAIAHALMSPKLIVPLLQSILQRPVLCRRVMRRLSG